MPHMPDVLLHFWCPDSPKLRQHRCPFPVVHPLHCILLPPGTDLHGRCSSVAAPSAVMDWLPTTAPRDSFCLPAWSFCCRSYFTDINLYRAQWKTVPGRTKAVTIHESTEYIEQKTQDHLPGHLNSCMSATLCGQTQDQTSCLMSYQALHGSESNHRSYKSWQWTSHRHMTLPFNDFLKVSIISFQATTPLNSGCPFFAHLLLMVA